MRPATVAAGALAVAAAGLVVAGLAAGGGEPEQRAAARPAASGTLAADGLAVWAEQGCGSCHAFAPAGAEGTIGPDLAASLAGMPESYIRESIVAPGAASAAGFSAGMMPEDYAQRIAPSELQALVAFIRSGVRD